MCLCIDFMKYFGSVRIFFTWIMLNKKIFIQFVTWKKKKWKEETKIDFLNDIRINFPRTFLCSFPSLSQLPNQIFQHLWNWAWMCSSVLGPIKLLTSCLQFSNVYKKNVNENANIFTIPKFGFQRFIIFFSNAFELHSYGCLKYIMLFRNTFKCIRIHLFSRNEPANLKNR